VIIFSGANPIKLLTLLVATGACPTIAEPPKSRTDTNDGFQQCFTPMAAESDARAEGRRCRNSRRQDIILQTITTQGRKISGTEQANKQNKNKNKNKKLAKFLFLWDT
jgi:hypothetical protein